MSKSPQYNSAQRAILGSVHSYARVCARMCVCMWLPFSVDMKHLFCLYASSHPIMSVHTE